MRDELTIEMEKATRSPSFKHNALPLQDTMSFPEALRLVMQDKKITRIEWGNEEIFIQLYGGKLSIHLLDDMRYHPLIVSDGDLFATDWIVVESPIF